MESNAWDGVLIGPENALAVAATQALACGDDGVSPLVVVGPAGSGKSRLLDALAADRVARDPGASIAAMTGERFAEECHHAADRAEPAGWEELRRRFRAVDLLAIDDLRAVARSPIALAELAATVEDLHGDGVPVAVSMRDDPGRWDGWPTRLADRLRGGLGVRLDPPGPSNRRRFLLDRARSLGLTCSSEAIDRLADAADGYRTLDGWLARLALASRIDRRPIDLALVSSIIEDEDASAGAPASIDEVTRAVARRFGVRPAALRSASRRAALVVPRHLAILLARELTGASFAALGRAFGGRDSKTVRHACRAASARIASDPALAAEAEAIRRRWSSVAPSLAE